MNIHEVQEQFGKVITASKAKDYNKSLRILDNLLLKKPDFGPGWNFRGNMLGELGNHFDSILNFNQAIACAPFEAGPYNNRGTAYLSMEWYKQALADFDSALSRD